MSTLAFPRHGPARLALRQLRRSRLALPGLAIVLVFVFCGAFAPLIAPYDPAHQSWSAVRKAPSGAHWLGTDEVGRDILSRIVYGARASLMAGLISVGIAIAVGAGVPLGLLAGYAGGWIDASSRASSTPCWPSPS